MSTTLTSTSTFTDILKHVYEPEMAEALVTESEVMDCFTEKEAGTFKVVEGPDGKQINISHLFSSGGGVGFMGEDDYLYTPTNPDIKQSFVNIGQAMAGVEISGRVLRRVKEGPAAFADWASDVLPRKVERLSFHRDRAFIGAGNGILFRINEGTPGATFSNIDSAYGIAGLEGAPNLILEGDSTRWGPNADGTSLRTGASVVSAVDYANEGITYDALPTSGADNDYVFLGDANVNGSGAKEYMGVEGIVDDGTNVATFQNLARATYTRMQGHVINASTYNSGAFAGKFTEDLIDEGDIIAWERGGGKPDVILSARRARNVFWRDLRADRRIPVAASEYVGGRPPLKMILGDRVAELRVARKVPDSRAYMLEKGINRLYRVSAGRWDDTTGSIWDRVTNSTGRKDAFWAVFLVEEATACAAPGHQVKFTNLVK